MKSRKRARPFFKVPAVIICSCNVLSDHEVRMVLADAGLAPRTPGQVYGCLGCSAQCGRCVRTIRRIMEQALAGCPADCTGCGQQDFAEPDAG